MRVGTVGDFDLGSSERAVDMPPIHKSVAQAGEHEVTLLGRL